MVIAQALEKKRIHWDLLRYCRRSTRQCIYLNYLSTRRGDFFFPQSVLADHKHLIEDSFHSTYESSSAPNLPANRKDTLGINKKQWCTSISGGVWGGRKTRYGLHRVKASSSAGSPEMEFLSPYSTPTGVNLTVRFREELEKLQPERVKSGLLEEWAWGQGGWGGWALALLQLINF